MKKSILGIGIVGLTLIASDSNFNLEYLGDMPGPFKNTTFQKFRDKSNGVICYLYLPESVSTESSISYGKTYNKIVSFAGHISCVKEKIGFFH